MRRLVLWVGLAGVILLGGCFAGTGDAPPVTTAPAAGDRPTEPADAPDSAPGAAPVTPEVPAPAQLGEAWTVDDSPEGGLHTENDSTGWLSPRDPEELVWGLAPLGCPGAAGAATYPRPASALQGRYRTPQGSHAVALSMQFDTPQGAAVMLASLGGDAATCTAPRAAGDGAYSRLYRVFPAPADSLHLAYTEAGPGASDSTWHVLGARSGSALALLYTEERPGETVQLPDPFDLLAGAAEGGPGA